MELRKKYFINYSVFFFLGVFFLTSLEAQNSPVQIPCSYESLRDSALERVESQSATVQDKIYVFAGFLEKLQITDVTEIYDPAIDQWSIGAPMPTAVTHMGIAVVGMDIWILGGFIGNHPGIATDRVQIYNVPTDSWSEGIPLPNPVGSGAAVFNDGKVHFFGGLEPDRQTDTGNHYVIDTRDKNMGWVVAPSLPEPRNHLGGAAVNGKIYALGGQFGHDKTFSDKNFVHVFDPVTEEWEAKTKMPTRRSHFEPGTAVLGDEIIIVGGRDGAKFFDEIISYNTKTDLWSSKCNLPSKLLAPVGKVVGNDLIVANGGKDGTCCPVSTTWKVSLLEKVLGVPSSVTRQSKDVLFFPNPARDILTFTSSDAIRKDDIMEVEIIAMNGAKILQKSLTRSDESIEIGHLLQGVYFVVFRSNKKTTSVRRLLKQ